MMNHGYGVLGNGTHAHAGGVLFEKLANGIAHMIAINLLSGVTQ